MNSHDAFGLFDAQLGYPFGVFQSALASAPENGFVYDGVSYYREGLALPLACTEGYSATYYVGGTALSGSEYTVNAADGDVTITAILAKNELTLAHASDNRQRGRHRVGRGRHRGR